MGIEEQITVYDDKLLEIMAALEKGEFVPYYQPKVNSRTKKLVGAEALVRWIHAGHLVSPAEFIPVMEHNNIICLLDYYMLEHVCADIAAWLSAGLTVPVISVNFSRRNLQNEQIAQDIDAIVTKHQVPRSLIEIEITETTDEFSTAIVKSFVDELHRLGYRVSIDDFGCGSSSLNILREITFDTLKIDKSFVDRQYAKDLIILGFIIKMARAINLEIIAEGVEQLSQLENLFSMGCEIIQGYYFDKPLPHDDFQERVATLDYYDKHYDYQPLKAKEKAQLNQNGDIFRQLSHIKEIELVRGMEVAGGGDTYLIVARNFYDTAPGRIELLREYYNNHDLQNYTIQVHALKTTARLLGAYGLSESAWQLEQAGRAGDMATIDRDTMDLIHQYERLHSSFAEIYGDLDMFAEEAPGDEKELLSKDKLDNFLEKMHELVESFDFETAGELLDYLDGFALPTGFDKYLLKLRAALAEVDRDLLLELLDNYKFKY